MGWVLETCSKQHLSEATQLGTGEIRALILPQTPQFREKLVLPLSLAQHRIVSWPVEDTSS